MVSKDKAASAPAPDGQAGDRSGRARVKFIYPTKFYLANDMTPVCGHCGERERTGGEGYICPVHPQPANCWLLSGNQISDPSAVPARLLSDEPDLGDEPA